MLKRSIRLGKGRERVEELDDIELLKGIYVTLNNILSYLRINFPSSRALTIAYADTFTVPPMSAITIEIEFFSGYEIFIRKVYSDAAPNCRYTWYVADRVLNGNEATFTPPIIFSHPAKIIHVIENYSPTDSQEIDVLIEGWGEPFS